MTRSKKKQEEQLQSKKKVFQTLASASEVRLTKGKENAPDFLRDTKDGNGPTTGKAGVVGVTAVVSFFSLRTSHVSTSPQLADLFTKALGYEFFLKITKKGKIIQAQSLMNTIQPSYELSLACKQIAKILFIPFESLSIS